MAVHPNPKAEIASLYQMERHWRCPGCRHSWSGLVIPLKCPSCSKEFEMEWWKTLTVKK